MKNILLLFVSVIVLTSCQEKIGYVDNVKLINDYKEKSDIEEKFNQERQKFQKRVDSLGKAFQEKRLKVEEEVKRLSKSKKEEKLGEISRIQQRLQQQLQFEQQQLQGGFQKQMDSVIKKVSSFVGDYAKTNGYSYILGTSEASMSVMYGKDESNLTSKITEALNNAYKK